MEMLQKETSHWWWFDSHHHTSRRSSWLQATLGELDMKTKAMLKLIEEDADSFAQRAEMYYKKRPELISMVEEFYRAHRSLLERYDQLKSDSGNRLLTTLGSPFSSGYQPSPFSSGYQPSPFSAGYRAEKLEGISYTDDSHCDSYEHEEGAESEVDDPEQEDEVRVDKRMEAKEDPEQKEETKEATCEVEVSLDFSDGIIKLRDEVEQLKEENRIQSNQLLQKDEEKREVIRQLTAALEVLKSENQHLRKCLARDSPNKRSPSGFEKWKEVFSGKTFFKGPTKFQGSVIAL